MSERDCPSELDWGAPWWRARRAQACAAASQRLDWLDREIAKVKAEVKSTTEAQRTQSGEGRHEYENETT